MQNDTKIKDENSIHSSTGYWITLLAKTMETDFENRLAMYGMTRASGAVLSAIHSDNINTPSALASFIGIDGAAITRHLDRIEKQGLVKRVQSPQDRRSIILKLTPKGAQLVPKISADSQSVNTKFMSNLTQPEIDTIQSIVRKMLVNADSVPVDI